LNKHIVSLFLGAFAKLPKMAIGFVVSVRPFSSALIPLDGFSWNSAVGVILISVEKIHVWLKSDQTGKNFTWRPTFVDEYFGWPHDYGRCWKHSITVVVDISLPYDICIINQHGELFVFALLRCYTSTCFGFVCSPSSVGRMYICSKWYVLEGTFTQHFIHGPVAFSEMFLLPYISQFIDNKFKLTITHFNNCVLYNDM
jgi:hypothetical protein